MTNSEILHLFLEKEYIGLFNKRSQEIILSFLGEKQYLSFITKKYNFIKSKIDEESLLKINSDLLIKKQFLSQFIDIQKLLQNSIWNIKGDKTGLTITKEKIEHFLNWKFDEFYNIELKRKRTIEVVDIIGNKLKNTELRKAKNLVDQRKAKFISENKIQLEHYIKSENIETGLHLREKLYILQSCKCKLCKKEQYREFLELHHKYIPQSIKKINYLWNTELLCINCHKQIHKNPFKIINFLIQCKRQYLDFKRNHFKQIIKYIKYIY